MKRLILSVISASVVVLGVTTGAYADAGGAVTTHQNSSEYNGCQTIIGEFTLCNEFFGSTQTTLMPTGDANVNFEEHGIQTFSGCDPFLGCISDTYTEKHTGQHLLLTPTATGLKEGSLHLNEIFTASPGVNGPGSTTTCTDDFDVHVTVQPDGTVDTQYDNVSTICVTT